MNDNINKIICDAIDEAIEKKIITSGKDITYPCIVTQIYPKNENTYQLTYQNTDYIVTVSNIKLNLYDKVHLVIPQGDFKNKFVLEDVSYNYENGNGGKVTGDYMEKVNPTGSGSLSINRKSDTEIGKNSVAIGKDSVASGETSYAEGHAKSTGNTSHAEGGSSAIGDFSHAEGVSATAQGNYSHAEGHANAKGNTSHAEGSSTAEGNNSHAESSSKALGSDSHAEGYSQAKGEYSHAEGHSNNISGNYSHAEGSNNKVNGKYAHAEGNGNTANGENQHVQGKFNIEDTDENYAHIIGNGKDSTKRSNAHTVSWEGVAWFANDVQCGGTGQDAEGVVSLKVLAEKITELESRLETILS